MTAHHAASPAVQTAVLDYFAGERAEMAIALAVFVAVAALAAWLFLSSRTGFALALLLTVGSFGGVMGAGLAALMVRDHGASRALGHALEGERSASAIVAEQARVGVVVSKFSYYRWGAAVLAVIAIAGLLLSSRGWIHGVAAGLLLVVVAQIVIDHFSETRARSYLAHLGGD